MIVCESAECRERNISNPREGRFSMEVDGYGDPNDGEYSCYYCGAYGYSCNSCDADYWCSEHGNGCGAGEQITGSFSTDVVWINGNKEPVHVVN